MASGMPPLPYKAGAPAPGPVNVASLCERQSNSVIYLPLGNARTVHRLRLCCFRLLQRLAKPVWPR